MSWVVKPDKGRITYKAPKWRQDRDAPIHRGCGGALAYSHDEAFTLDEARQTTYFNRKVSSCQRCGAFVCRGCGHEMMTPRWAQGNHICYNEKCPYDPDQHFRIVYK